MKLLRKLTAFILAFGLLAGTVAAMSAAVYADDEAAVLPAFGGASSLSRYSGADDLTAVGADVYVPRLRAPALTNPYYYSDRNVFYEYGYGLPNCTCYAWGRAYEILHTVPALCIYSAYQWYDYNVENGPYAYGTEPRLGAIACWSYASGSCGHVAVVEKIENGKITFSNSAYNGDTFYTTTAPIDDPSAGNAGWLFQGYIYLGDFAAPSPAADSGESPSATDPATDKPAEDNAGDADETGEMRDSYRIIDAGGVNLRAGAGTSYPVVGFIGEGEQATVTEICTADGYQWGRTEVQGTTGWFALDYAEKITSDASAADQPSEAPDQPIEELPAEGDTDNIPSDREPLPVAYDPALARDILIGDLDDDGLVTIIDATRIQLIIAGMFEPDTRMLIAGDYDGDSYFSIMDASRIRYHIAFEEDP